MIDDAFGPPQTGTPAPCRGACPVGTDAAAYVALLADGRLADAYDVARQHNPFASVCGRICAAPCERACRRSVIDAPVSIRAMKRVLCDAHGAEQGAASRWARGATPVPPVTGASVGIVGAGPAGLAAAHDLRLAGYAVTVYEAAPLPGGMMRYGIPAFRLPRAVLDAEIDAIRALGIDLRLSCAVGRDITIEALLATHAAVLVTAGCQQGRALRLPGVELPGVLRAVDFLRRENERVEATPASGSLLSDGDVVVIGGGSVAFDAARSAWRTHLGPVNDAYDGQTALDAARTAARQPGGAPPHPVTLVAPETRSALPVPPEELHEAMLEGVTLRDGTGVLRILGETHVTGVEVAPVQSLHDATGRVNPQLDLSRTTVLPAHTVVLAIGQQADTDFLAGVTTVARTAWGGIVVDEMMRSTDARVWAAGDVASGPRDLIEAVAGGQRAARSIAVTLEPARAAVRGRRAWAAPMVPTAPPLGAATRFWSRYDDLARTALPVLPAARRDAVLEVEAALDVPSARAEGQRCLRCDEQLQFAPERCIACAMCVDVCPQYALALLPSAASTVRDAPVSGRSLALLFNDDVCIRCGLCVYRCPTDALVFTLAPAATAPHLPAAPRADAPTDPSPTPLAHA